MVEAEVGESHKQRGACIVVGTELRHADMIRSVDGAKYDTDMHRWTVPLTWQACVALRGVFGQELAVGPRLAEWSITDHESRILPALQSRVRMSIPDEDQSVYAQYIRRWRGLQETPLPDGSGYYSLYPYQETGVQFLVTACRCLLTDEMGTGKTAQVVRALRLLHELHLVYPDRVPSPFPTMIIAPNTVLHTWRQQFEIWWPTVTPVVVKGPKPKRDKMIAENDVIIMNWESVRGHSRLAPYGSVRLQRCRVCDPTLRVEAEDLELVVSRLTGDDGQIALDAAVEFLPEESKVKVAEGVAADSNEDTAVTYGMALIKEANRQVKLRLGRLSPSRCEHCPKELNAKDWHVVVCDEAHRMKDPKAKQTRAVWACATDQTTYRFALTGTPIANNPLDLWSALHFTDDRAWVSKSKYTDRYVFVQPNYFGGITVHGLRAEHRDEFFKAVDPRMRRMPKEAVLPFLPKKTYVERRVELSPKERKAYDQMASGLVSQLDDGVVVAANPLVQLTRLVQFASSYATLDQDGHVHLEDPSCKVDGLVDLLDDLDQQPLVVFAMSRQLIELAAKRLTKLGVTHGLITGGQSPAERQHSIDQFQGGRTRVILGTVQAGGVGITLTRSPNLAFLQRSWSLVENNQAEDRVHRIGAEVHDKIVIFDIIADDTIEARVRDVIAGKWEQLEEFVRDRAFLASILKGETS